MLNVTTSVYTSFIKHAPAGTRLVGDCAEWVLESPSDGSLGELPKYGEVYFDWCIAGTRDHRLLLGGDGSECVAGVDRDGDACLECDATGRQLWHACPRCGDTAFEYINGHDEADGMRCTLGCGSEWAAYDLGWTIQRLPVPETRSAVH